MEHTKKSFQSHVKDPNLLSLIIIIVALSIVVNAVVWYNTELRSRAAAPPAIKLGTFVVPPSATPVSSLNPVITGPAPITTPIIGGPQPPDGPLYCIDDQDASGCDDQTAFLVPKGAGGASGSCGTVIEQAHKIIASLPHDVKYGEVNSSFPEGQPRDRLDPAISSSCYPQGTGTYPSGYLSTYLIIDAYNLAGFQELSKTNSQHVEANALMNWWKGSPAGYTFIPYSPSVIEQYGKGQLDLSGCVMFLKFPSGVFPSIVNKLEVYQPNGDGVISVLQANAIFYLDRFIVAGWAIQNTLEHGAGSSKPMIDGIDGFGCHT